MHRDAISTVDKQLLLNKRGFVGPTFTLNNRIKRLMWSVAWGAFARFSPPPCHKYRLLLLRLFGARVSLKAYVYADVEIWAPWNLYMDDYATLGRGVVCYNISPVKLGRKAVVSQFSHLCTGTHDYNHPDFPLYSKPIEIGARAWICANTFVGPGVHVGEGAVLAAGAVANKDLEPWAVYAGNPAKLVKRRARIVD